MSLSPHNSSKYLKTNSSFDKMLKTLLSKSKNEVYRGSNNRFSTPPFSESEISRNFNNKKINSLSKTQQKQKLKKNFFLTLSKFDNIRNKKLFINIFKNRIFPEFPSPKYILNNDIRDMYVNNIMANCCNIVKFSPPKNKPFKKKLPYINDEKKFILKNNCLSKIFRNKMIKKHFVSLSNEKNNFNGHYFNKNDVSSLPDNCNTNKKSFKRIIIKRNENKNNDKNKDILYKNNNNIYSLKNIMSELN